MSAPSPAPFPAGLPPEIGGYRVVRLLGRGTRAITALVHADAEARVARIFSLHCPPAVIDGEVAAHDAIRTAGSVVQRHVVALDDLVTLADGRLALLVPYVAGPRLDDVLAARHGRLDLGEAITVLAPLAGALDAVHQVGITAIGLQARDIRFSPNGATVITRVHGAVASPALPHRFRALEPAYVADHAALGRLGAEVAAAVRPGEQGALLAALRAPAQGRSLVHALFDCADPMPVRVDRQKSDEESSTTGGGAMPRDSVSSVAVPNGTAAPATGASRSQDVVGRSLEQHHEAPVAVPPRVAAALDALRVLGLPTAVIDPVDDAVSAVVATGTRAMAMIRAGLFRGGAARPAVRPRFVLAGAAGVAALIAALGLVAAAAGESVPPPSSDQQVADVERGDPAVEQPTPMIAGDDAESSSAPEFALDPVAEEWPIIVDTLVDRWLRCRVSAARADADLDDTCVASVAHRGSAAERLITIDDTRHAVLERWSAGGGETIVVERMGGAVLVDLVAAGTTTASLLLVRSEAGWRLRDVIG